MHLLSGNSKGTETERKGNSVIRLILLTYYYLHVCGNSKFHPALSFQREQIYACRLWRSLCVMLIAKNRKFCKIRGLALVGEICITSAKKKNNRKFRNDLLKNREVS